MCGGDAGELELQATLSKAQARHALEWWPFKASLQSKFPEIILQLEKREGCARIPKCWRCLGFWHTRKSVERDNIMIYSVYCLESDSKRRTNEVIYQVHGE